MSIQSSYPLVSEFFEEMGEVGARLSELGACEGAAGNLSVCFNWDAKVTDVLPLHHIVPLPIEVPELAGYTVIATGSGVRLPEICRKPQARLCAVKVMEGGKMGQIYQGIRCDYTRPTSEFNSHLAIHALMVRRTGTNFHAVVHTHPPYLTYLTHIPRYQDQAYFNQHVLRWQPEMIVNLPDAIGWTDFCTPGTAGLMQASLDGFAEHRVIVWSKHGIVARSEVSIKNALDLIEYAEAGARYEFFNLISGEHGEGLKRSEVDAIDDCYHLKQSIF